MTAGPLSTSCSSSSAAQSLPAMIQRISVQSHHSSCNVSRPRSRLLPVPRQRSCVASMQCRAGQLRQLDRPRAQQQRGATCTYPEPETEKERSSVDFPQEWMTPQPSRRPDPMPEFEKLETPLPRKLPGDPEVPDEDEEEEEEKKKKDPDKDNPDKEKPDAPPSEE